VTHVDGLVLARSGVSSFGELPLRGDSGTARLVTDRAEKMEALRVFTEHVMKGRWDDVRQPTEQELKAQPCWRCHSKKSAPRSAPAGRSTMKRITLCRYGRASCHSRPSPKRPLPMRNGKKTNRSPLT